MKDLNIHLSERVTISALSATEAILRLVMPVVSRAAAECAAGASISVAGQRALDAAPHLARYFDHPDAPEGFGLRREYSFPKPNSIERVCIWHRVHGTILELPNETDQLLIQVHDLIDLCSSGLTSWSAAKTFDCDADLLNLLLQNELIFLRRPSPLQTKRDGLHRLQHAALLARSGKTGILIDPHAHSKYEPLSSSNPFTRSSVEGLVDAILITHSHEDHYNIGSLLTFPRDLPIVIPKTANTSLICPDMREQLTSLGFTKILSPEWGEIISVGAFSIAILPFFGEQPLSSQGCRHEFRNWGNTYLLRSESTDAWILADAGHDAHGSMVDVAEEVRQRFGKIGQVISNLRTFWVGNQKANPFYISGTGSYWLSLNPDQMQRFSSFNETLTLGPSGVAEVCARVGAQSVLPYAHWWCESGTTPLKEAELLSALQNSLSELGAETSIIPWRVGDNFDCNDSTLSYAR